MERKEEGRGQFDNFPVGGRGREALSVSLFWTFVAAKLGKRAGIAEEEEEEERVREQRGEREKRKK